MKLELIEAALEKFGSVSVRMSEGKAFATMRFDMRSFSGTVTGEGKTGTEAIQNALNNWPNNWPLKYAEFVGSSK